jgi:DNA-binding response OmpR family regulator
MSLSTADAPLPDVLLADADLLLRRAVVQVAAELTLARIHDTSDVHAAVSQVESRPFRAMVIALDGGQAAIDLLTLLRCGQYPSPAATPVAVLTGPGRDIEAARLSSLGIRETLRSPCSARGVLDLIARLLHQPLPGEPS